MTFYVATPITRDAHRPAEIALLLLLAVTLAVVVGWYRQPPRWGDALLMILLIATVALLAFVMLG